MDYLLQRIMDLSNRDLMGVLFLASALLNIGMFSIIVLVLRSWAKSMFDEIHDKFDALHKQYDVIVHEYHALKSDVDKLSGRLDR